MNDNKLEPDAEKIADRVAGETTVNTTEVSVPAASRSGNKVWIGPYRLVRKVGQGGMGQVWLAEQTTPLRRHVAIKLIKAGLYDDAAIERLKSERQSLAAMNHPAIAKVFDAGSTSDGQPYFVMEYVEGVAVTSYCDAKKLKIRERLKLFIKVCDGVQHAHQKAIIHRDLKPSNVLVVEVDGKPVPRIIDFGIAKTISSQPVADQTIFTRTEAFVGTPGFISPEQADPSVLDVDTRTDVYSLGVILYLLLTGTLPFDTEQWKKKPLDEVLRQLREEDAPRPSTKVEMERALCSKVAELRGTEPNQLKRMLRGDLDWINMKALEKERNRRYGTPAEVAADITRYMNNEPVVARPAGSGYRLQKYVRRHRFAVGVATGLVLLLAGFSVLQAIELRRITRERDRANRIGEFMIGMFKVSDPSQARGNSITAREILDKASKEIDPGLSKDPDIQAQMMQLMGSVYEKLGLYGQAQAMLASATNIRRRVLGPQHSDTLKSMDALGVVLEEEGRYAEAEKLLRQTLDIRRHVLGNNHPDTLQSMNDLGIVLGSEGHLADAEKLLRESLEIKTRVLGREDRDTLNSMQNLGTTLYEEHQTVESEKLLRESLEIRRRVFGPDAPDTLSATNNLANILDDAGRHAEAEKLMRESLEIETRVLGPEHPDTLRSMHNLGDILYEEGRYDEAEKLLRETLNTSRRVLGPEYPDTAASIYSLGSIALRRGNPDEALADLREAVDHGLAPDLDLGIERDPDLQALHGDPRFEALVIHAKERAEGTQQPKQ
jgi:eukaryotic-like serine/threonine-protein kinase